MSKPRLVLIGNGMAGVRAVEELLKIKPDHYDITIFGAEPHPNYNRILLSPVLAGEMTISEIVLNELDWYKEKGIKLHTSTPTSSIFWRTRKTSGERSMLGAAHSRFKLAPVALVRRLPSTAPSGFILGTT
jgi:nitrite reductase (NADH) large subunit